MQTLSLAEKKDIKLLTSYCSPSQSLCLYVSLFFFLCICIHVCLEYVLFIIVDLAFYPIKIKNMFLFYLGY